MPDPSSLARQLVGRAIFVFDNIEGDWKVYPALIKDVPPDASLGYGPWTGPLTAVYVLGNGTMQVCWYQHVGAPYRLTNHGWTYGREELNETGQAFFDAAAAWLQPIEWLTPPRDVVGEHEE